MPKPSLRDGERVPPSTQIYESNVKLLGVFLWTTVLVFVFPFYWLATSYAFRTRGGWFRCFSTYLASL